MMKTIEVSVHTLEALIEGLECAINVCYNVDSSSDDCEKSYPYAAGYSRAAMESTVDQLKTLKSQIN
jgi:hypothetical protein